MNMLSFDTNGEVKDNYKMVIGGVLPRPIAVVSTINEDGSNNVAPFSFFTVVSVKPMILAFCPLIRTSTGKEKDTPINIKREKEFVISIVTEDIAQKINETSAELPYGQDEFVHSGLTPLDSETIKAKRIKESPIHYECKLKDFISYGDQPGCGQIILGEVQKVHIAEEVYDSGRIVTSKLKPVGRGAGNDWFKSDSTFELERLMKAQIQK